jgi:hypothetical protein
MAGLQKPGGNRIRIVAEMRTFMRLPAVESGATSCSMRWVTDSH